MRRLAFAVTKEKGSQYTFTHWHDTFEEAIEEAERLVKKERCKLLILKLVAWSEIEESPVKTTEITQ